MEPARPDCRVHKLEDEGANAAAVLDAENGRDVRMVERGEDARLPLETGESAGIRGERGWQDLQRDFPVRAACRALS